MLGAFLVLGLQPGPMMMTDRPEVFWGIIASMYIGNIFLLILNLPLIPYIARLLTIPRPMLISLVIMFSFIGVYAISFSVFDLYLLLAFGVLGLLMRMFAFPAPPFILAFILGGMMEQSFRQSMTISGGNISIFFENNISLVLIIMSVLSFIFPIIKTIRTKKKEA